MILHRRDTFISSYFPAFDFKWRHPGHEGLRVPIEHANLDPSSGCSHVCSSVLNQSPIPQCVDSWIRNRQVNFQVNAEVVRVNKIPITWFTLPQVTHHLLKSGCIFAVIQKRTKWSDLRFNDGKVGLDFSNYFFKLDIAWLWIWMLTCFSYGYPCAWHRQ